MTPAEAGRRAARDLPDLTPAQADRLRVLLAPMRDALHSLPAVPLSGREVTQRPAGSAADVVPVLLPAGHGGH